MSKILTISIAAYQVEDYIRQALDSLISPDIIEDLEIFVIDDGGKDSTLDIVKEYAKQYPSSIFPVHKENGGYGSTVNYSIKHATGKYFKLLDGDDWFEQKNLVKLARLLRNTEADCVIFPWITMYEKNGKQVLENRYSYLKEGLYEFTDQRLASLLLIMYAVAFRTAILRNMGKEITEHCFYTDNEYVVYPIPYIRNVYVWNRPVYIYRVGRKDQSMGVSGIKRHYKEHEKVLWNIIRTYMGMDDGPQKTAVETRLMINIAAQFKYLCYFPLSKEKRWEMERFYHRLSRRCPELIGKTERNYSFVRMYAKSHGALYPVMRFITVLYVYHLLTPFLWLRNRFRDASARFSGWRHAAKE